MKPIGDKLKTLRQKAGLTQKELGDILHVSHQAVSKWERNQGYPDPSMFSDIANALNTSVSELFYENVDAEEIKKSVYKPVKRTIAIIVILGLVVLSVALILVTYTIKQNEYKNSVQNAVYVYNKESNVKVSAVYGENSYTYVRKYFFDGRVIYSFSSADAEKCFYEGVLYEKPPDGTASSIKREATVDDFYGDVLPIEKLSLSVNDIKTVEKKNGSYEIKLKNLDNLPIAGFLGFSNDATITLSINGGKISSLKITENEKTFSCDYSFGYDFVFSLPEYVKED